LSLKLKTFKFICYGIQFTKQKLFKIIRFSSKRNKFLLDLSIDLKKAKYNGTEQPRLKGKNIALIFEKASTRTRCAFEVAAFDQGALVTYLRPFRLTNRWQRINERYS
jgi:ornithine carbamoyltransferase